MQIDRAPFAILIRHLTSAYLRTPQLSKKSPRLLGATANRHGNSDARNVRLGVHFGVEQDHRFVDAYSSTLIKGETSMLRSMKDLEDYAIGATDGSVGHVKDFLFDDDAWVIRYFVVDTGTWLSNRKVLISPIAIGHPNWAGKVLPVLITKEQVKKSPDIDTNRPVSRQHETEYLGYYGYPYYWGGAGLWGGGMYPYALYPGYDGFGAGLSSSRNANRAYARAERARHLHDDPHLRSCKAVIGYHIHAKDGEIGHVSGLLVDEQTWAVRYLVVATGNWGLGHEVLISPEWIDDVRWIDEAVSIDLNRQSVKDAPPYDSTEQLNRQMETGLYRHYERPGYWPADKTSEADEGVVHK